MNEINRPIDTPCPNCKKSAYYCPTLVVQHPDELVIKSVISCLNCYHNTVHEFGVNSAVQRLIVTFPMPEFEQELWRQFESECDVL